MNAWVDQIISLKVEVQHKHELFSKKPLAAIQRGLLKIVAILTSYAIN